jgi:hypothetical protein
VVPLSLSPNFRARFEVPQGIEPLEFIEAVMREPNFPIELRLDAAKAAAPYRHERLAPADMSDKSGIKVTVKGGLPERIKEPHEHDPLKQAG